MDNRRLMIPAFCPRCGAAFASGIVVGFGAKVSLRGNMSRCRRCGAMAAIPDGFMEILDGAIKLFSGPDFTRDVYKAIGIAVDDLRSGRATERQAISDVTAKSKKAGTAFREWLTIGLSAAALMWTIGGDILAWRAQPKSNMHVEDVVSAAIEGYITGLSEQPFLPVQDAQYPNWKKSVELPTKSKPDQKNRKQRRAERAQERRNRR